MTPKRIGLTVLGVALLVFPYVDPNNARIDFLKNACAFVLLALGLNIVVGFAGLLDLGYAAFFAIGSYSYAMLASPQFGIHLPFWAMLFIASAIAAVFGILLGAPTLRLRGDYLAIVTLGTFRARSRQVLARSDECGLVRPTTMRSPLATSKIKPVPLQSWLHPNGNVKDPKAVA